MKLGVPKESTPGEKRVALVPDVVTRLAKLGVECVIEKGAGAQAYYSDQAFADAGAKLVDDAAAVCDAADVVVRLQPPTPDAVALQRAGSIALGFMSPHRNLDLVKRMCEAKIIGLAMELVPRISRAQSMDALSSQASIAGYKAVIMGADRLGKFLPMLTTPTGTIRPAKVLIVGVGVAGLQAIATARRLGAIVEAYDVRTATKEQVESLGAKFVDVGIKADSEGGYARELTEEEKQQQREVLAKHVGQADVVITTAAVPGRPSPRIVFTDMVERMRQGAVIVDLAAEGGGNCELTKPGETVEHGGVQIYGPLNVPSMVAVHASEMYAKNVLNLVTLMIKDGKLEPDWNDEVLRDSTLTRDGEIKHAPTLKLVEGEGQ